MSQWYNNDIVALPPPSPHTLNLMEKSALILVWYWFCEILRCKDCLPSKESCEDVRPQKTVTSTILIHQSTAEQITIDTTFPSPICVILDPLLCNFSACNIEHNYLMMFWWACMTVNKEFDVPDINAVSLSYAGFTGRWLKWPDTEMVLSENVLFHEDPYDKYCPKERVIYDPIW